MTAELGASLPSHRLERSEASKDWCHASISRRAACNAQTHLEMAPSRRGVSRSLSTHLVRADTYPVGSEIWTNDEDEVWVLAEVISQENTILAVRRKSTGERLEIDLVRERLWGREEE